MKRKIVLLSFLILLAAGFSTAKVELGSGVEIHQDNTTVNITEKFNVSSLTVYQETTNFGGVNFTVSPSLTDSVDLHLRFFNGSASKDELLANYTANTTSGNNVSFKFSDLAGDSWFEAYQNTTFLAKREKSTSGGVFEFFNDFWTPSTGYQSFYVNNTSNAPPGMNSVEVRDDRRNSINQLVFGLDDNGEKDISSYTGSGSKVTFTNSSLRLSKSLPVDDNYTVSDWFGITSSKKQVDVSTTGSGLQSDDYNSNLSYQQVNESVTAVNNGGSSITYNLTLKDRGTVVTSDSWSFTISSGMNKTKTGVWSGDWINHATYKFKVQPTEVDLDKNYTGERPLELEETKGVSWSNLSTTGFTSTPSSCGQSNATTVSLSSNTLKNTTVSFDCDSGNVGSPALHTTDKDGYTRYWYNTTLHVDSNLTEDTRLTWPINEDNLNQWDDRDSGSAGAEVDNKSSDLEVTDGAGTTYLTVQTDFGSSSLHEGDHEAGLTYTVGKDDSGGGGSSGGGGGSGGGDGDGDDSSGTGEITIGWSRTEINGIPGQVTPGSFTVRNFLATKNQVSIVEQNGTGCQFLKVESATTIRKFPSGRKIAIGSGEFSDHGSYTLPSRTASPESGFYSTGIDVRLRIPRRERIRDDFDGQKSFTCRFSTSTPSGKAKNLTLILKPRATVSSILNKMYVDVFPEFLRSDQPLLVKRSICLNLAASSTDQCPEKLLFSGVPTPAANPFSLTVFTFLSVVSVGVLRLLYIVGWRKIILWK